MLQRLDGMMSYVDALRTTSHEFMNKLHVILGLLNMKSYGKLEEYVLQTRPPLPGGHRRHSAPH